MPILAPRLQKRAEAKIPEPEDSQEVPPAGKGKEPQAATSKLYNPVVISDDEEDEEDEEDEYDEVKVKEEDE